MENQVEVKEKKAVGVKAVVTKLASADNTKKNGSIYNRYFIEISQEGHPAHGMKYFGIRTTINKDGVIKKPCEIDEEVLVYASQGDPDETGKRGLFFEIERMSEDITDAEDIAEAFGF